MGENIRSSAHNKPRYNLGNKPGYITCWRTFDCSNASFQLKKMCVTLKRRSSLEHFSNFSLALMNIFQRPNLGAEELVNGQF